MESGIKTQARRPSTPRSKPTVTAAPLKSVSSSRKSAGKREAIVQAAIEIINNKSFPLATMTEIAAALDLRDAALYYYFPDKQALGYACHHSSLARFEDLLHAVDAEGGSGVHKLRQFIYRMLVDSDKNGAQLYFGDYSYLDAPQREAIKTWADRLTGILVRFLKEGMADGSVVQCEPEFVVQLLLGMLIWLAKWCRVVKGVTPDSVMEAINAFCFQGLERRAQPSSRNASK